MIKRFLERFDINSVINSIINIEFNIFCSLILIVGLADWGVLCFNTYSPLEVVVLFSVLIFIISDTSYFEGYMYARDEYKDGDN